MKHASLFLVWIGLTSLLCAKSDSFPQDQCTWHAAERFDTVAPKPGVNWRGNAGDWFRNAANNGWETRTGPMSAEVGAIIVWSGGFGNLGHVAIVTRVSGDKREIGLTEKNWRPGIVTEMTLRTDDLRRYAKNGAPYQFLGYIMPRYRGKMSVAPRP